MSDVPATPDERGLRLRVRATPAQIRSALLGARAPLWEGPEFLPSGESASWRRREAGEPARTRIAILGLAGNLGALCVMAGVALGRGFEVPSWFAGAALLALLGALAAARAPRASQAERIASYSWKELGDDGGEVRFEGAPDTFLIGAIASAMREAELLRARQLALRAAAAPPPQVRQSAPQPAPDPEPAIELRPELVEVRVEPPSPEPVAAPAPLVATPDPAAAPVQAAPRARTPPPPDERALELDDPTLAAAAREGAACWRGGAAAGERVSIGGIALDPTFSYIGSGLVAIGGGGPEPALIDPALAVERGRGAGEEPPPEMLGYGALGELGRAAYLRWLAAGRPEGDDAIEWAALHLAGLERRALIDAAHLPDARAELGALVGEIESLLLRFAPHPDTPGRAPFARSALGLLETIALRYPEARSVVLEGADREVRRLPWAPERLRAEARVAAIALRGEPLAGPLLLSVALTRNRRAAALKGERRLRLRELFLGRYAIAAPDGAGLWAGATRAEIPYRPLSPGFGGRLVFEAPVPDAPTWRRIDALLDDALASLLGRPVADPVPYTPPATPAPAAPLAAPEGERVLIPASPGQTFTLRAPVAPFDPAEIERKRAESDRVAAMLAALFSSDESDGPPARPAPATPPAPLATPTSAQAPAGDPYARLLARLLERERWTQAEYRRLCAQEGVGPLAGLDVLNERALDRSARPLAEEEGELILIDRTVALELTR